jgi:hypothetical protein
MWKSSSVEVPSATPRFERTSLTSCCSCPLNSPCLTCLPSPSPFSARPGSLVSLTLSKLLSHHQLELVLDRPVNTNLVKMALPKEIKELILHELVRTNRVSDSVLRALLYDGVKTLDLRWCAKILGSSWGAVAGVCGSLTTLNLSGCKRMLGENMAVLARATANSLVNLVLDGCAWHILVKKKK